MATLDKQVIYYPLGEFCMRAECGPTKVIDYQTSKGNLYKIMTQISVCKQKCNAYKYFEYLNNEKEIKSP